VSFLRAAILLLLPLLGTLLVAFALGWVGRFAYVIGMAVLGLGLTAGALSGIAGLTARGQVARFSRVAAVVSVLMGWGALQWMDDVQFQRAFVEDFAAARFADSGAAADEGITDDDIEFFGEGAEAVLEEQVTSKVGVGGLMGRWLLRADAGVRLAGPWHEGRGLDVGRVGAVTWALLEILLALMLALSVLSRIAHSAAPAMSSAEVDDDDGSGTLQPT